MSVAETARIRSALANILRDNEVVSCVGIFYLSAPCVLERALRVCTYCILS